MIPSLAISEKNKIEKLENQVKCLRKKDCI